MNRRQLIGTLPAAAILPVPAVSAPVRDPMIDYAEGWLSANEAWIEAVKQPDGGNFDSPACLHFDRIKDEMEVLMRDNPIRTAAGFSAFCRFMAEDNNISDETCDFPQLRRWQVVKMIEWSEAQALIGSAA